MFVWQGCMQVQHRPVWGSSPFGCNMRLLCHQVCTKKHFQNNIYPNTFRYRQCMHLGSMKLAPRHVPYFISLVKGFGVFLPGMRPSRTSHFKLKLIFFIIQCKFNLNFLNNKSQFRCKEPTENTQWMGSLFLHLNQLKLVDFKLLVTFSVPGISSCPIQCSLSRTVRIQTSGLWSPSHTQ